MTANKRILLAGLAIALAADCGAAQAQQAALAGAGDAYSDFKRDRNVSVRQRPHQGYEALGIRAGAFMIWPKVATTVESNDNIKATAASPLSDTVWHVVPELSVTSNWSRHSLQAYARSTINRYSKVSTEDTTDYSLGAVGRLDILRTETVNGGVDWSRLTEPRTSASSPSDSKNPIQYETSSAFISAAREFNRLRVSGRLDLRQFDYLNGVTSTGAPVLEKDRDRLMTVVTARADYAISPDTALFVQVAGNDRNYRLDISPTTNRDSQGLEALVGANFELSALVRGEIGVGYLQQSFKNTAFSDISGLGARAQVEWFATQLTTVTFTGSRTIEDAGIIGSSGYLSSNIGAQVDYELLRNVILGAQLGYGNDDYRGIDRTDRRFTGGINATYLLNRGVGVTVGYSHFEQTSRGAAIVPPGGSDFTVDKVGATLTLQY
ncbi:hypothetical protein DJ021_13650 [Phenylobacterium hankyongense]|uniref:Outer membrane protein beta-barrel domain-containing protein n=1 Tax=Phenylobacterium hankyongense TaxID=1813876 RepID=A0A328B2N4_9CAUL|nr:outer membrane beta-barrel protein [Phenylobacterium hankyongense]RAK60775.1 hypothetical protein DJ021_13650 [Phenylobacterium hankyongense]